MRLFKTHSGFVISVIFSERQQKTGDGAVVRPFSGGKSRGSAQVVPIDVDAMAQNKETTADDDVDPAERAR